MLRADGDMPLSYDKFLENCRGALSDAKYKMVSELTLSSTEGPLVSEWSKFYGALKAELTYQRNVRLGRKAVVTHEREESVTKLISSAMNNKNPLAAEEMLLTLEFERLDELIGIHSFDDHALMGYALKLKLLERKKAFKKELGKKELDRIVDNLEREIISMEQD